MTENIPKPPHSLDPAMQVQTESENSVKEMTRWRYTLFALRSLRLPLPKLRSDVLMVIATCFSAVAAGGSFWAALRQEDATYRSQLYDQQVEAFGHLESAVITFAAQADRIRRGGVNPDVAFSALRSTMDDYTNKIGEAIGPTLILAPRNVSEIVRNLDVQVWVMRYDMAANLYTSPQDFLHSYDYDFIPLYNAFLECVSTLGSGKPLSSNSCGARSHTPDHALQKAK